MENIRCLIADIPQLMLADIFENIIETRPGIQVVDRIENYADLLKAISENSVDVVIHSIDENDFNEMDNLFKASPQILSVGLRHSGRLVCFCIENIGPDQLLDLLEVIVRVRKK